MVRPFCYCFLIDSMFFRSYTTLQYIPSPIHNSKTQCNMNQIAIILYSPCRSIYTISNTC